MSNIRRITFCTMLVLGLFLLVAAAPAWAGDGGREWRPIYDLVMRWINFGILVFFLVKVVGPLLVNFLNSQKTDIQSRVERAQSEKDNMLQKVQEAKDSLENSGPRLEEIRNRIVDQGERHKQETIEKALTQSQLMMKNARQRIDNQINQARKRLMNEMMDMAMEKAIERLPAEITPEDDNRLIRKFLSAAERTDTRI